MSRILFAFALLFIVGITSFAQDATPEVTPVVSPTEPTESPAPAPETTVTVSLLGLVGAIITTVVATLATGGGLVYAWSKLRTNKEAIRNAEILAESLPPNFFKLLKDSGYVLTQAGTIAKDAGAFINELTDRVPTNTKTE